MTVAIEGYRTSIISEDGHPEKFGYILVEHQGKLTDDILEAIKDDVSSRYAWVYAQSQISRLKVRIKSITTLSRMHSIEESSSLLKIGGVTCKHPRKPSPEATGSPFPGLLAGLRISGR